MTSLSANQIAGYAYQAGFRGDVLTKMVAIAFPESGGNPNATHTNRNGSIDYGVWQINSGANGDVLRSGNWRDPAANARMAYTIWQRQGLQAWATYNSGAYLPYMGAAIVATRNITANPPTTTPTVQAQQVGFASSIGTLTNPHTWLRLAMIIAGGVLILAALGLMGWQNTPDSVKKVAKVAVTKKVS